MKVMAYLVETTTFTRMQSKMAALLLVVCATTITLSCAASGRDITSENGIVAELIERIDRIEAIQQAQKDELLAQKTIIEAQAKEIAELKAVCKTKDSYDSNDDTANTADTANQWDDPQDIEITGKTANEDEGDTETATAMGNNRKVARPGITRKRFLEEGPSVAFSVYLDHNVELGSHQTLKFNQVITNEGGGYNTHTGVFTCPSPGIYMFAFFIGERDGGQGVWADLVVNSKPIISAAVDTFHATQDLQGGNMVIVRLAQGDVVWVDQLAGSHVEGQGTLRLTSFSGTMLYQ